VEVSGSGELELTTQILECFPWITGEDDCFGGQSDGEVSGHVAKVILLPTDLQQRATRVYIDVGL